MDAIHYFSLFYSERQVRFKWLSNCCMDNFFVVASNEHSIFSVTSHFDYFTNNYILHISVRKQLELSTTVTKLYILRGSQQDLVLLH